MAALLTSAPHVFSRTEEDDEEEEERQAPGDKQGSGPSGEVAPVSGINLANGQHAAGHLPRRRHGGDVKWMRVESKMRPRSS